MLHLRKAVTLGLLTGLSGIVISFAPLVRGIEENIDLNLLFKLRGPLQAPTDVIIVNIDKHSADKLKLPDDPKKWPRSLHASLIENLIKFGASVIAFDLFFDEPTFEEDDNLFAKAINNASNVVLCESLKKETVPLAYGGGSSIGNLSIEKLVLPIPPLAHSALALAPFPLPKVPVKVSQYWAFKTSAGDIPTFPVAAFQVFALKQYDTFIKLLEKFNPSQNDTLPHSKDEIINSKGIIKVIQILRDIFKNKPQIAERMLEELQKSQALPASGGENQILKSLIKIYQSSDCRYLNFYGPPCTFITIPYHQVLQFSEIPDTQHKPTLFKGKAVFIGSSGSLYSIQKDAFYTVFSQSNGADLSGVEIAATAFANILEDMPVQPFQFCPYLIVIFLWGIVIGIFCHIFPSIISAASVMGISGVYLITAEYQFKTAGIWCPVLIPLFFQAPLAFFSGIVWKYIDTNKERKNIRMAFRYYIPDEIVDQLSKNIADLKTHSQLVYGTCLSTDAEHYTALSETMNPKELRSFINNYYGTVFEPIKQHGGIVTNVIGDSALAIWVTMHPDAERRKLACLSALAIEQGVHCFNQSSPGMQLPTRIGLHSGHVLLANIGAIDHYEYRPIGDIVNTATRIEGMNKYLGTRILVSEDTINQLDDFLTRELGKFLLVGKSKPLVIYELLCRKEESNQQQRDLCLFFSEALDSFKRRSWYEAIEKFYKLIKTYRKDGPSHYFLTLCKQYRGKQFGESWNGVIIMGKK